ncbi:GGDEF domain-containing protein [Alcanivorax sp. JB21]|uniref:GGDEF domain-containing protein n=1 Tax=Alcanivorax limicola TaxID=2874102 RepID=UPI001CBD3EB9|nr:diguanylate cyclase [Alcanivorax limicola]MBZ2190202.1 GGDEF domain-containing protein [Alcanivorax limicola]
MDADLSRTVEDVGEIERLLDGRGWRLRFPPPLEAGFRSHHDDDALRVFRSSLVYLALLYFVMAVTALTVLDWEKVGAWPFMFSGFAVLIIAAWRISYTPLIRQRYQQVVCGLAALVMLIAAINPMLEQDPEFRTLIHIGGVFAVVVVYLGLSLRLPYAMLAGWGGGLPPLYIAHTWGVPLDWVLIVPTYFGASVLCMVLGFRDERQRRRMFLQGELLREDRRRIAMLAEELSRQALVDGLTGLANRRQFDQALSREWARALREEQPLALIFADIDYFKLYNDHFGHQEGDDCMRVLAGVFRQQARRATDLAARYGGEEFVLLLPGTGRGAAIQRAEELAEAVRACQLPHPRSQCAPVVTVSVGVVSAIPGSNGSEDDLVGRADQALYQAKAAGRNRVQFAGLFQEPMAGA